MTRSISLFIIMVLLFISSTIYSQSDSLNIVMNLILKADQGSPLNYKEMTIIMKSFNKDWGNNVELMECRMNAINSILFSSHNLSLLLKFMDNNRNYNKYILDEIMPSCEIGDSVYFYLNQQNGYNEVKIKILDALSKGVEEFNRVNSK